MKLFNKKKKSFEVPESAISYFTHYTMDRGRRLPYSCSRCLCEAGPVHIVPIPLSEQRLGNSQYFTYCDECFFNFYRAESIKFFECCGWRGNREYCGSRKEING